MKNWTKISIDSSRRPMRVDWQRDVSERQSAPMIHERRKNNLTNCRTRHPRHQLRTWPFFSTPRRDKILNYKNEFPLTFDSNGTFSIHNSADAQRGQTTRYVQAVGVVDRPETEPRGGKTKQTFEFAHRSISFAQVFVVGGSQEFSQRHATTVIADEQQATNNGPSILDLPDEIYLQLFSFLSPIDLCQISGVCKKWYRLATDDNAWTQRIQRDAKTWPAISSRSNPLSYALVQSDRSQKEIYLLVFTDHSTPSQSIRRSLTLLFSSVGVLPWLVRQLEGFDHVRTRTGKFRFAVGEKSSLGRIETFSNGRNDSRTRRFWLRNQNEIGQFPLQLDHSVHQLHEGTRTTSRTATGWWYKIVWFSRKTPINSKSVHKCETFVERLHGLIYVIDASQVSELGESLTELQVMTREFSHLPLLILSCVRNQETKRWPAIDVVKELQLSSLGNPWTVQNCCATDLSGVEDGFNWILTPKNDGSFFFSSHTDIWIARHPLTLFDLCLLFHFVKNRIFSLWRRIIDHFH